jgi:hypothetical protein
MSPLFLMALTAAAKMVRDGYQVDRELGMAGVDDDMKVDWRGIVTQDLQNKNLGSETLFGNFATKINMPHQF